MDSSARSFAGPPSSLFIYVLTEDLWGNLMNVTGASVQEVVCRHLNLQLTLLPELQVQLLKHLSPKMQLPNPLFMAAHRPKVFLVPFLWQRSGRRDIFDFRRCERLGHGTKRWADANSITDFELGSWNMLQKKTLSEISALHAQL